MGRMAFSSFDDQHLALLAFGIFFSFFIGTLIWVSLKSKKDLYEQLAKSPLNDGDHR